MVESKKWKMWYAFLDLRTCIECKRKRGKVYALEEKPKPSPPLHNNCRCEIIKMKAVLAGNATNNRERGADWYIKYYKTLPDYYITSKTAKAKGWNPKSGNLDKVAPDCMLFGGVYSNKDGRLPDSYGRVWYEADINYISGYRNKSRLLFSNDGLIFVTYNHYQTFCEVV